MKKLIIISYCLLLVQQTLPDFGSSFGGSLTGSFIGSSFGNLATRGGGERSDAYWDYKAENRRTRRLEKRIENKEKNILRLTKRLEREQDPEKIKFFKERIEKLQLELDELTSEL